MTVHTAAPTHTLPEIEGLKQTLGSLPEDQRKDAVAATLMALLERQKGLQLPSESPAIITDQKGQVVAFSVASRGKAPGEPAVIDCLRKAAKSLNTHQLDGLGLTLHLIGQAERFDGSGAVYNYGPSHVHIVDPGKERFQSTFQPVSEEYWREAGEKRGMTYSVTSVTEQMPDKAEARKTLTELAAPTGDFSLPTLPYPEQPMFVRNLLRSWSKEQLPLTSDGRIDQNSRLAKELMQALHFAAETSVISGGGPFAAAIVSPEGKVVSFGVNRVVAGKDAIAHGEVSALREALRNLHRESGYLGDAPQNLDGFSLVTSSITCISCAEQLGRYGITRMYYENSKADVESNTPFTEGPLRGDFWTRTGIEVYRITTDDEALHLKAFRRFQEQLQSGQSTNYLTDHSQG